MRYAPLLILLLVPAFVPPAEASYIAPPSYCAGSYCDPGDLVCSQSWCIGAAFDCSWACIADVPCGDLCDVQVPAVGVCTYSYCDWQGAACAQVGDTEVCKWPQVPAACVGSLCEGPTACAWSEFGSTCIEPTCGKVCTAVGQVCDRLAVCDAFAIEMASMGACAGNPQNYDANAPDCHGGIFCADLPDSKLLGDFCVVIYWVA